MVEYTPEYSLPYVGGNDYVQNYPATASKPLAERVEAQLKDAATRLAEHASALSTLETKTGTLETKNTALEGQVTELEAFKDQMYTVVGSLSEMLYELSQKKTQTIVSDFTSDTSEKFVITRVGSLVTIAGSLKSTEDAESANYYVEAIRLPGWAHPGSNGNNVVFETEVNSPIGNEYTTGYGRIVGFQMRFVGPFSAGDTVRGYATYITDRDFS